MATHMPMATTRQPFAPLNSSRLQNLTSLKNRQNALPTTLSSPTKRKANAFEDDDAENVDPTIFLSAKRSRAPDGSSKDSFTKPTNFFLTKAPPSPSDFASFKPVQTPTAHRPILTARSPTAPKLNTSLSKSTPLSAPAGRSPTRKRIGILNRRRTSGSPFTRVDPPKFAAPSTGSGLGFSIDAALSGTIPSYGARSRPASASVPSKDGNVVPGSLRQPEAKESWFFDIHEDTAEELATNLMEHSTCTLDISSDEESAARLRDERGKENVPPPDDVSQTRTTLAAEDAGEQPISDLKARIRAQRSRRQPAEEGAIELDRCPLGDLVAEDFYAEGCDESSVLIIPSEEGEEEELPQQVDAPEVSMTFDFTAEIKGKGKEIESEVVDALMEKDDFTVAPTAALLEPIEKPEDNFEVWESGSAKDEAES